MNDKWLATIAAAVQGELDRVSQILAGHICQLAKCYAAPLPQLMEEADAPSAKFAVHLQKTGHAAAY